MKTKKRNFSLTVFLFCTVLLQSQNEFSKWVFGFNAGLDFSTSPPTVFTNANSNFNGSPGCATICDNTGNLLFYTDGFTVFNSTHNVMANGNGLPGYDGLIAIKQPGNNNLYYVFYSGNNTWIKYSIVDMSLSAGLGSVSVLNTNVFQPSCAKLLAVRHCNGKDTWIISHDYSSNQFRSFLLTSTGISSSPVVSATGPTLNTPGASAGDMQVSPNGKLLAMIQTSNSVPSTAGTAGFYLFDFDPSTGIVSNSFQLSQTIFGVGVEFSADGKKLYGNAQLSTSSPTAQLYQWDLCAGSNSSIAGSKYTVNMGNYLAGGLRRAIDGKIYQSHTPSFPLPSTFSIDVINSPNSLGSGMNFVLQGQNVGPKNPGGALPNYINSYIKPTITFTPNQNCQNVSFAGPAPSFTGGCNPNAYPINGYLWNFGEPSSGAANTSTAASPAHSYSTTGTYSVKLIVYSNCTNDTIVQVINVNNLASPVTVSGNSVICKGDNRTYTATGASTYSWTGSSSTTSLASLNPTLTTTYTLTGFANGCSSTKVFTVTVEPCQGISKTEAGTFISVYPNPFNDELRIDIEKEGKLKLISLDGKLVMETQIQKGSNTINTGLLKPGLYIAECEQENNLVRFRVVKGE